MKQGFLKGHFWEVTRSPSSEFEVCHPVNVIDEIGRTSVSIEGVVAMPSPGSSSPWHSFILVQCPAMCPVPDRRKVCPAVSPVLSFKDCWLNKPRVVFTSVGTFFSLGSEKLELQEISENTAPHLPWYAAYVILHERKTANCFYYYI